MSALSPETCRRIVFRRQLKAAFDADGKANTAKWLSEEQQRFAEQIHRSGIRDKCEHLLNDVADVAKINAPFEVFVIGEGKFGKSTFINALLGCPLAPMDFLPKTWCFNRYIATNNPSSMVKVFVLPDFDRRRTELRRWLQQPAGQSRGLLVFEVSRETADDIIQYEERIFADVLQHKVQIDDYNFWGSPIMEMEWEVPDDKAILPGIRLVDTQGINQLRQSRDHLHYLKWQFSRADAVIWMMSAEKINSSATREELVEAQRYSKRIILVVNRWDKIQDPVRVKELCERLYADYVSSIVYFSSIVALVSVHPPLIQSLPGPAKADVAHVCKVHGIPNPLQYPEEAAQKLRYISGRDHLAQVLNLELTQKLRYIRNRTLYTTLRQQQREFRRIALQTVEEKRQNLTTYQMLRREIQQAYMSNERRADEVWSLLESSLQSIRARAERIRWSDFEGNADTLRKHLGFDNFNALLRSKVDELSRQSTQEYQQVVVRVSKETAKYRDSEFDPLGRVAFQQTWTAIGDVTIRIDLGQPPIYLAISQDLIHTILELIPILGDIFAGVRDRKRNECVARARNEAIQRVTQTSAFLREVKEAFMRETGKVRDNMLRSVDDCFNRFGGEQKMRREIEAIERALSEPAVRCFFFLLPLRAMKKLGKELRR